MTEKIPQAQIAPIYTLICSCCGGSAKGRQWYNRDEGFGLCNGCIDFVGRGISDEMFKSAYGVRGVHYDVERGIEAAALKAIARGRGVLHVLGMLLETHRISATKTKIKRLDGAEMTLYQLVQEAGQAYDELESEALK